MRGTVHAGLRMQVTSTEFRSALVDFCGPEWTAESKPATCCSENQFYNMISRVNEKFRPFVMGCPACWNNFKVR